MYTYYLILKGNNKDLATTEFETLWNLYYNEKIKLKREENVMYCFSSKNIINSSHELLKRLTLTNYLGIVIKENKNFEQFKDNLKFDEIKEAQNLKFAIRLKKSKHELEIPYPEKALAKPIWDLLENPKVSLEKPDIEYNFILSSKIKDKIVMTKKLHENPKEYMQRMPKFRPVVMPYTLKSDMARAAVNLLNLKEGTVLDPFCGIGGILLEAVDMNFKVIGNDISWNDLKYFKQNFDHYYPKAKYKRILADSSKPFLKDNSVDGIVSDIPYGRCSRKLGEDLYENFLKNAKNYLKPGKRMVIIYANFVEFKDLALKYFDKVVEIDEFINRSMTRHILVLENNK